jgi:hypothetical protein
MKFDDDLARVRYLCAVDWGRRSRVPLHGKNLSGEDWRCRGLESGDRQIRGILDGRGVPEKRNSHKSTARSKEARMFFSSTEKKSFKEGVEWE